MAIAIDHNENSRGIQHSPNCTNKATQTIQPVRKTKETQTIKSKIQSVGVQCKPLTSEVGVMCDLFTYAPLDHHEMFEDHDVSSPLSYDMYHDGDSSFNLSDSDDDEDTDENVDKEDKENCNKYNAFIIFISNLLLLFKHCIKCGKAANIVKTFVRGSLLII